MIATYKCKSKQQLRNELLKETNKSLLVLSGKPIDRQAYYKNLTDLVNLGHVTKINLEKADVIVSQQFSAHSFIRSRSRSDKKETKPVVRKVKFHPDLDREHSSERKQRQFPPSRVGTHDFKLKSEKLF
jgi:hypothetical protein